MHSWVSHESDKWTKFGMKIHQRRYTNKSRIHQVPILCIKWKHLWHNINFNPLIITCTGSLISDKQCSKWLGDSADQIM